MFIRRETLDLDDSEALACADIIAAHIRAQMSIARKFAQKLQIISDHLIDVTGVQSVCFAWRKILRTGGLAPLACEAPRGLGGVGRK
jgi:hypothetical protein